MGWLYGWRDRASLIKHLIEANGLKTLAHCCKGNNLWAVQEGCNNQGVTVRFIALYLLHRRSDDGWGYKDMDESAGPYQVNCPLAYLEMVADQPPVGYAAEWREKVRAYHEKRRRKLEVGQRIRYGGNEYTITSRLSSGGYILDHQWRLTRNKAADAEVLT